MSNTIIEFVRDYFEQPEGFIPLHEPHFIGNEKKYVNDAIDSTFVSSVGKYVDRFEEMIKEYTHAKYAIATVSGTAALHMSLILSGVKHNELVITQPLSFIATCNCICYIGAEPLFIDVDKDTLGLSPSKLAVFLEDKTTFIDGKCIHIQSGKRIAAIIPMHTFGHPAKLDELVKIADKYNIPLIEDAAESIGSKFNNQHTGTFGILGAFSFNGNKTITCGGGGMIVTNDEKIAKLAKHLTTQAKIPHKWDFKHDYIGYNYRLPNINAALACAQMEKLDDFVKNKRKLALNYSIFFKNTNIHFCDEPNSSYSNYWLNAILVKNEIERDKLLTELNDNGIMSRPAWTLMNKLEMFKHCICDNIDNAIDIENRLINLPSSVK